MNPAVGYLYFPKTDKAAVTLATLERLLPISLLGEQRCEQFA